MADNPQTVLEFTENLLSDLSSGTITAQEALSACQQYSFLRQELGQSALTLSQAALLGDEELTQALISVVTGATEKLSELPSFRSQEPDKPETEEGIRGVANLQQQAVNRLRREGSTANKTYQERRRAFIHDLVNRYSSTVPGVSEGQVANAVDRSAAGVGCMGVVGSCGRSGG